LASGLHAFIEIGAGLKKSVEDLAAKYERAWNHLQKATPVTYRVVASANFVTGVPLVLNFGSPDSGTFWEINSFSIGGTDVNVTAAGSFGLYVSGYVSNGVSPGMGALVTGSNTAAGGLAAMPYSDQYGGRQILVNESESVYAIVYGGTNGQNYVANIQASVYNVAAGLGRNVNVI
jgi:hypothetical protein